MDSCDSPRSRPWLLAMLPSCLCYEICPWLLDRCSESRQGLESPWCPMAWMVNSRAWEHVVGACGYSSRQETIGSTGLAMPSPLEAAIDAG